MITDIEKIDVKRITRRTGKISKNFNLKDTSDSITATSLLKLDEYRSYWDSLYPTRQRYHRACRYDRGDQWSDYVVNDDGDTVTEETYIKQQGRIPLKQNIIRPLAKSLLGLYRTEKGKSIVISRKQDSADLEKVLSNALQHALHINETREIDPRTFELYLLSGLPVQKVGYDMISELGRYDIVIEYISPEYIFFNTDIKDVRLKDLRVIGQIHDVTLDELFVHFAKTEADKKELKRIYTGIDREYFTSMYGLDSRRNESLDFYLPSEQGKCRVIEVWEKRSVDVIEYWDQAAGEEGIWEGSVKELEEINNQRIRKYTGAGIPEDQWALIVYETSVVFKWFFKYLSPNGHILREGETPYDHGSHPYIMYPYPLINGEVWGAIEDVIDQQRYINRLVTMWDYIMGTASKNAVVFDVNSLDGQSVEQLGEDYRQVGGVIALDLSKAKPPIELGGKNTLNFGVTELISMQLKWMQDISGVQPAMQGQSPSAGTPSSRYAQESMNATNNSRDLLESFNSFRARRDFKVLKTIIQYYKTPRYMAITGNDSKYNLYDPEQIKGIASDFDLVVGQSTDSPVYKSWMDDMIMDMVRQGFINLEMALPHINAPWATPLLEDIRNMKEQVESGAIDPSQAQAGIGNIAQQFNQQQGVDTQKIATLGAAMNRN